MKRHLYQELASHFRNEIRAGQRLPGERMPSIRELCRAEKVSRSTVLTAYGLLEAERLIESRPRSGYIVSADFLQQRAKPPKLANSSPAIGPVAVTTNQAVVDIMDNGAAFDLLPNPAEDTDNTELRRSLARAYRKETSYQQNYYDTPLGSVELRSHIAGRLHTAGSHLSEDQLLITSGCQHALLLALMATTQPGDVVAIESPAFYGAIQLIEALDLQILELPSSPVSGISVDAIDKALKQWRVSALVLAPSYSTPTGACLTEDNKQAILKLCLEHSTVIIEDDIYGELYFGLKRPRTIHSYDTSGNVLLCSSFSKCLSRDLRIGWIAAGRFLDKVKHLKIVTSLSVSASAQRGLADYIRRGYFERHLRSKRLRLSNQCLQLQRFLSEFFPAAISWTQPEGGLTLWVELNPAVDTGLLYQTARREGITTTPGIIFSSQQDYGNFLRLSFAHEWTGERVAALKQLGLLVTAVAEK